MSVALKYRTFDELLTEAYSDFEKYHQNGMIQGHQLIKVAQRVNYELGLRINKTKEAILELDKGRVKLPNDFYSLNYAFLCGKFQVTIAPLQGTHIEERRVDIPEYQWQPDHINTCTDPEPLTECNPCPSCQNPTPCGCVTNECNPAPRVCLNCKGEQWELIQIVKYQTRTYKELYPLRFLDHSQDIECGCPNLYMNSANTAWIKDGWLYTNIQSGTVYINYQGMMEDDQGNLLVLDHPMINEFYEYALKSRIIENLIMNDEPVNQGKIQIIETRLRAARNNAISIARMPNFAELKKVYESNRKAQYSKYYDMFRNFSWFNYDRYYSKGLGFTRTSA